MTRGEDRRRGEWGVGDTETEMEMGLGLGMLTESFDGGVEVGDVAFTTVRLFHPWPNM